jgi:hypothetical protein
VTICAGRLAGAKIERDGEKLERPMSSSGLWWADDDVVFTYFHKTYAYTTHATFQRGRRGISNIPPRPPRFIKLT